VIVVKLRNRKGRRSNKKHSYVSSEACRAKPNAQYRPCFQMYEVPEDRSLCVVSAFLALALADGAFESIQSFSDLEGKQPIAGSTRVTYHLKESMKFV
jgi:hypothetical protein